MKIQNKKSPALSGPGLRTDSKTEAGLLPSPNYSPIMLASQTEVLAQLETEMAEADATGDIDRWLDAWFRWLVLWPEVHTPKPPAKKHSKPGALGELIDQAISKLEYHRGQAYEHRLLVEFHEGEAAAHRRILTELETLIPFRGVQ